MELVIVLLLLSLFIGMFSQYMFSVFSKAEQRMVERTVININAALYYRASMMVMQKKYDEVKLLTKVNPMKGLQSNLNISDFQKKIGLKSHTLSASIVSTPSNYGGEIVSDYINTLEEGKWYFVIDNNVLLYKSVNALHFNDNERALSKLHFQVKLDYKDHNLNGIFEENIDEFYSVRLHLIDNNYNILDI